MVSNYAITCAQNISFAMQRHSPDVLRAGEVLQLRRREGRGGGGSVLVMALAQRNVRLEDKPCVGLCYSKAV